jgi:hypothetical protein
MEYSAQLRTDKYLIFTDPDPRYSIPRSGSRIRDFAMPGNHQVLAGGLRG